MKGNNMDFTVTEAMTRLKLYDKKITDKVAGLRLATFTIGSMRPAGFASVDDYVKDANAGLQSANALIGERERIKRAIVNSNAVTRVKVGQVEMTVAEAIELKSSIKYKKSLLDQMKAQYAQALVQEQHHNTQVNARADEFVQKAFPNQANANKEEIMSARETWIKANIGKMHTADKLKEEIERVENSINEFETHVDVSLSLVNATTIIHI